MCLLCRLPVANNHNFGQILGAHTDEGQVRYWYCFKGSVRLGGKAGFGVLHASQLVGHAARLLYLGYYYELLELLTRRGCTWCAVLAQDGGGKFPPEICSQSEPPPFWTPTFWPMSARSALTVTAGESSSISTNRKSKILLLSCCSASRGFVSDSLRLHQASLSSRICFLVWISNSFTVLMTAWH